MIVLSLVAENFKSFDEEASFVFLGLSASLDTSQMNNEE